MRLATVRRILLLIHTFSNSILSTLAMSSKLSVAEFAAKPFVQRALKSPLDPMSALSFFFGVDYSDLNDVREQLVQGKCLAQMSHFWYGGGVEYDALCQPFADAVRKAGSKPSGENWPVTCDTVVARLILCDQLSRNIFRGKQEAFAYEDASLELAESLTEKALRDDDTTVLPSGTLYDPYKAFVCTALMHSEKLQHHEDCLAILEHAIESALEPVKGSFEYQKQFALEHKTVIDKFGRYPHRNVLKNRESTPAELVWLQSADVPMWAKSQSVAADTV
jgi:uncharacterized protein (DUF924 family)